MKILRSSQIAFSALGERALPPTIARLMTMALETPGLLSLAAGFTDNATLPEALVRKTTEALGQGASDLEFLQYGTNQGRSALRQALASRIQKLEPELSVETLARQMIITNGSQQALYLAMQVLCDPGDIVLVDRPSYFVFLEMLTGLGIRARSLPLDDRGQIDGAGLSRLLQEIRDAGEAERVKAVYFVSYFSNPSARSLEEIEKRTIATVLAEQDFVIPVIEDAAYRDLYYETPHSVRSVLTLPEWSEFPRFYTATLTKSFATGLKVGYGVCTDEAWLYKMMHVKGHHDFGTTNFNQAILARVLADGGFDAQLKRIRVAYLGKMHALHDTLVNEGLLELGWRWDQPKGGLYLWLSAPEKLDTGLSGAFCRACIDTGVLYVPGELCFGDKPPQNLVRLSFGVLKEQDLAEAGRRFVSVARRFA